MPLPHRKYII